MRSRVAPVIAIAALLALGPSAGATADPSGPVRECRHQWAELVSLHAENGNPGGPVPELGARWDTTYASAQQYADTAGPDDCGTVLAVFAERWDDLESFMYALYRYDPMGRLALAENDRRHALHLEHVHHLSPWLERQFRVARRQAPRAARDLAPALSPASTVDTTDGAATDAVLAGLRHEARTSHHEHVLNHALRIIGNAELDEE